MNKKIVFSLLTIGIFACVASAGTWAYFQDTITSTGNGVKTADLITEYSVDDGESWVPIDTPDGLDIVSFSGTNTASILPTKRHAYPSDYSTIQKFRVRNNINSGAAADLYFGITPKSTAKVPDLIIYVDGLVVYNGNYAGTSSVNGGFSKIYANNFQNIGPLLPGDDRVLDITYNFWDNGQNQNSLAGQKVDFDLTVQLKATP